MLGVRGMLRRKTLKSTLIYLHSTEPSGPLFEYNKACTFQELNTTGWLTGGGSKPQTPPPPPIRYWGPDLAMIDADVYSLVSVDPCNLPP